LAHGDERTEVKIIEKLRHPDERGSTSADEYGAFHRKNKLELGAGRPATNSTVKNSSPAS